MPNAVLQDLAVDRKNPNLLAAAGQIYKSGWPMMGVFISSDGGTNWTQAPVSSKKDSYAYAVARDPVNPSILYVGGQNGQWKPLLCKSANGGASWTDITKGIRGTIIDVAVDPASPRIVYAVEWGGSVWKSGDGGGSWTELSIRGGYRLIINPNQPNELFLGTAYDGVFYSADQGATWKDFSADMDIKYIRCLDLDPAARILYASTEGGGIYKGSF